MLKMKMTFDLQSKMEVIEACFILVTFALFFSNAFSLFPKFPLRTYSPWKITRQGIGVRDHTPEFSFRFTFPRCCHA